MKTTTDHAAALHSAMYDAMLEMGELISPRNLPEFVAQFEEDTNAPEMDADTVREALRRASNDFANAMIQNEHDTHPEPHLAPLAERVAKWEALRPITRRTAELAAAIAAPSAARLRTVAACNPRATVAVYDQYGQFHGAHATADQARAMIAELEPTPAWISGPQIHALPR